MPLHDRLSQFFISLLKVYKYSVDFISVGRLLQIYGPIDVRLLEPKEFDLTLYGQYHLDFVKNSMRSVI